MIAGIEQRKDMVVNNISKPNIAKNIRRLREKKGISQDRLSKLADLALSTITGLEHSKSNNPNLTVKTLWKIAKALEVPIVELLE
jgi:transcriptional regulator with XRE-family HTH domain